MKKVIAALLLTAMIVPMAVAEDYSPQPWPRKTGPNTTYAEWYSWMESDGQYLADGEYNLYGSPTITGDGDAAPEVLDTFQDRDEVLHVMSDSWLNVDILNMPVANPSKDIYLQITWWTDISEGDAPDPYVGLPATGSTVSFEDEFTVQAAGGGNWVYSLFRITIEPNPSAERIEIYPYWGYDMYIDHIVVDTMCVPEPASLALLAMGGLVLIRRK